MVNQAKVNSSLYALLIGIDCYRPNRLPDGSAYKNLGGAVRDINHVEAFLKQERLVPEDHILKLTSSPSETDDRQPKEPPEQLPTRNTIINSFRKIGELAPPGSQLYIQYSGHGGRAKTVYPDIKGENGIDEGLVPLDIGDSAGQYLRDLELAQLLQELTDKDLMVTLVLDCCHSGGATRGDVEIRGVEGVDDKPLQSSIQPVAPVDVLAATWRSLTDQGTRGLKAGGLPDSKNYVVLAACRQNEYAYEYAFNRETRERNGALTYWLLDTLRQQPVDQTYKDLYDRIHAKIHSQFPQQTPILIGEDNRKVLGSERIDRVFTVAVQKVEVDATTGATQAVLSVGQVNGVGKGTEFVIYPRGTAEFTKENRIARARIIQRGGTESLCQLAQIEGKELKVEPGDQAVLASPSINLVRKVALFCQEDTPESALDALQQAIPGNGWVELATQTVGAEDDEGVAYQVVSGQGMYQICDRTGAPFPSISAMPTDAPDAALTVVKRLVHLARFHAAAEIDNTDSDSPLAGKLAVEWLGTSDLFEPGDKIPPKSQLMPFPDPSRPTVRVGEYIFLSIQNQADQVLNVAVLDLASDWSIEQIYPGKGEYFVTLDAGQPAVIPLPASSVGEDVVKVFATVGPANFRWLELPPLDVERQPKALTRSGNPLDALFAAIDAEQPPTRKLSVAASPSREWTTKQLSLTVV